MNRLFSFFINKPSSLVVAISMLLCNAAHAYTGTVDTIQKTHQIRIGYRLSSIPFSYTDNDQKIIGYSIDICRSVAFDIQKALNLPKLDLVFIPITSQNRTILLDSGTIDIDCGSTSNLWRRRTQADFSHTTFVANIRMIVKKQSGIKSLADIGERAVVVSSGTAAEGSLEAYQKEHHVKLNIIYAKDHANSFLLLLTGRASGFVNDDVLLYSLRARLKRRAKDYIVLDESMGVQPYALMFRREDNDFKKMVNQSLDESMRSGRLLALYNKWFTSPIPPHDINLEMPLSKMNDKNFKHPNDRPGEFYKKEDIK